MGTTGSVIMHASVAAPGTQREGAAVASIGSRRGRCQRPRVLTGSHPSGRWPSRQVQPPGPTTAACGVPAGRTNPSPGCELHGRGVGSDQEGDRAGRAHQQLGVAVLVHRVAIAWTVRPGVRLDPFVAQPSCHAGDVRTPPSPSQARTRERRGGGASVSGWWPPPRRRCAGRSRPGPPRPAPARWPPR